MYQMQDAMIQSLVVKVCKGMCQAIDLTQMSAVLLNAMFLVSKVQDSFIILSILCYIIISLVSMFVFVFARPFWLFEEVMLILLYSQFTDACMCRYVRETISKTALLSDVLAFESSTLLRRINCFPSNTIITHINAVILTTLELASI